MEPSDTLERLAATIAARRGADPAASYVAQLNARGVPVIARKLGEDAVVTIVGCFAVGWLGLITSRQFFGQ